MDKVEMKRYIIIYDNEKIICNISINRWHKDLSDYVNVEYGSCYISAGNILEALEKYKSMTGNEIK